jgi:hypothetical protein
MHRVFFDSNAGGDEWGYLLWFDSSRRDLEAIGAEVREGLHVVIYMPQELEAEAVLKFDNEFGCWRAIPVPGTMKHPYP